MRFNLSNSQKTDSCQNGGSTQPPATQRHPGTGDAAGVGVPTLSHHQLQDRGCPPARGVRAPPALGTPPGTPTAPSGRAARAALARPL